MSPRNLHTRAVTLSVVLPDAPRKTSRGKATTAQNVSYSPFIHKFSLPPMRGTDSRATTHRLHIQKAPRICTGLNTRESSRPAENANIRRSEPPTMFSSVMANPTQMSPSGPQTANAASPHPARKTTTESAPVESLRMKKAYRIFPAYSKNSDQLGPLSGYISPSPRISVPGLAGIRQAFISVAASSIGTVTLVTSHTEQPWK